MHRSLLACAPLLSLLVACASESADTKPVASAPATEPTDTPPADTPPAVDNGAPSTTYPAPHPAMPELVNQAGGKTLASPKVHVLVYPGYEHTADIETFAKTLGATPYWSAVTKEYGVSALTWTGTTELTGKTAPATISDTDVEALVKSELTSGDLGTPDPETIYAVFFPSTTTITQASGPLGSGQSCTSFGGYHGNVALGGKNIPYAVMPTCASFGDLHGIDELTGAFSHELVEAATDPYPMTNGGRDSAFAQVDMDHFIWILAGGMEAGDLCAQNPDAFAKIGDFPFTVQRSWSNASAKAGHDPCIPAASGAFFQSAPKLDDDVTLELPANLGGSLVPTKGIVIPKGESKTIEVDLYSDGPTSGPWTVAAIDAFARIGDGKTLDFAWDRTTGVNGEKLHLTVTVTGTSKFLPGAHAFIIASKLNGKQVTWPGLIVEK